MKVLSNEECQDWLKKADIQFLNKRPTSLHIRKLREMGASEWFTIPKNARYYLALADRLCRWFDYSPVLLLITDWPFFSEEEMATFVKVRQLYGYHQALIDAPGHYFETRTIEDNQALTTLLHYMMVLNWEGFLLHADKQSVVGMADQVVEIITADSTKLKEAKIMFDDVGIAPVKHRI